jgi:hypothetical protein
MRCGAHLIGMSSSVGLLSTSKHKEGEGGNWWMVGDECDLDAVEQELAQPRWSVLLAVVYSLSFQKYIFFWWMVSGV